MSTVRIDPSFAALVGGVVSDAAQECRDDEHVRIEQLSGGRIGVGISNGHVVRDEREVVPFGSLAGGYVR